MTSIPNNAVLQWSQDEKFEIAGKDLEVLVQVVRVQLSTPEAQRVMTLQLANEALNRVLEQGIKDLKISMVPEESKEDGLNTGS